MSDLDGIPTTEVVQTLRALLRCLPDANREEACWKWCWEELDDQGQSEVKAARAGAVALLERIRANLAEASTE